MSVYVCVFHPPWHSDFWVFLSAYNDDDDTDVGGDDDDEYDNTDNNNGFSHVLFSQSYGVSHQHQQEEEEPWKTGLGFDKGIQN